MQPADSGEHGTSQELILKYIVVRESRNEEIRSLLFLCKSYNFFA
jgi:hypothetical protein